jgi:hypothetical protein
VLGSPPDRDPVQAVVEWGDGGLGLVVDGEKLATEGVTGRIGSAAVEHGDALRHRPIGSA